MIHPTYHETSPEGIDLIRWPHRTHPLPEAEVMAFFSSRDIETNRWVNDAETAHPAHAHEYKKTLFCIAGSIVFSFPDAHRTYTLNPGDRLIIPRGLKHSALVGSQGVTYIEGKDRNETT